MDFLSVFRLDHRGRMLKIIPSLCLVAYCFHLITGLHRVLLKRPAMPAANVAKRDNSAPFESSIAVDS